MRWVDALKEWNSKRGGKYFIPKKDSAEYLEVKALMGAGGDKPKIEVVMGPASDKPMERSAARSHDFRLTTSAIEHARSYKPAAGGAGAGAADPPGEKWIQEAVAKMKKGAFTAQAGRRGKEPMEFATDVLANPGSYTETTRKRAQFLMNIQKHS